MKLRVRTMTAEEMATIKQWSQTRSGPVRLTRDQAQIVLPHQVGKPTAGLTRTVYLRPQEQHPPPVFSSSTPAARQESLRQPRVHRDYGGD